MILNHNRLVYANAKKALKPSRAESVLDTSLVLPV